MAAYATPRLELAGRSPSRPSRGIDPSRLDIPAGSSLLDALIDQVAERVAEHLSAAADPAETSEPNGEDEWFDSRHAATYLGVHRDTLRKLAAEGAIPSEQDGPNCKLYFRRSALDCWRAPVGGHGISRRRCSAPRRCRS